jgi:hypothetical protein
VEKHGKYVATSKFVYKVHFGISTLVFLTFWCLKINVGSNFFFYIVYSLR